MTPAEYRRLRQERGTLKEVARQLGVDWTSLQRRETGRMKITREAKLALLTIKRKAANSGLFKSMLFDALVAAKKRLVGTDPSLADTLNDLAVQVNQCDGDANQLTPTPIAELRPAKAGFSRKLHLR